MDELRGLAALFREPTSTLAAQVPPEAREKVISRFAVWMLSQSIQHMRTPDQRARASKIQSLHLARANGETIAPETWRKTTAGRLSAHYSWPPQWLAAATACLPGIALAAPANLQSKYAEVRQHCAAGLNYWCVLYRSPSCADEAALQIEARQGSPGPYADWLAENDPEIHPYVHAWLTELTVRPSPQNPRDANGSPEPEA